MKNEEKQSGEEVYLVFPTPQEEEKTSVRGAQYTAYVKKREWDISGIKLGEFVKQFEKAEYKVDQIELWIEGRVESGGVTKFFVSLEAAGGCKVILKPRT